MAEVAPCLQPKTVARTTQALRAVTRSLCVTDISLAEGDHQVKNMVRDFQANHWRPHEDYNLGQLHAVGDQGLIQRERAVRQREKGDHRQSQGAHQKQSYHWCAA